MSIDFTPTQRLDLGSGIPVIMGAAAYTITAWIQRRGTQSAARQIVHFSVNGGTNTRADIKLQHNATPNFAMRAIARAPDGGSAFTGDSASAIPVETFPGANRFIAVVYDAQNKLIDLYINGVLGASRAAAFTASAFTNSVCGTRNAIGALTASGGGATPFDGLIESVRGYRRRLSANEIRHMYWSRDHDGIHGYDFWLRLREKQSGASVVAAGVKDLSVAKNIGSVAAVNGSPVYAHSTLVPRRRI
jgi:hypothetical protein